MPRSVQWLGALDFGRITVSMRVKAPRCPQPGARCGWKWHVLEGVVDTGSTTLGLPENLVNELGLVPTSFREARTAGGLKRLPCIDELEIEVLGRSMISDAIVTPPGGMALVGHKQLAELNLLIDARKGEVRVGVGALPEPFAPTKSLNDVIPALRPRFEALLAQAIAWGMKPEIRSAGRTCEQQNEQLKLGYSQASMCRSMHTLGHAVDLNLSPSTCATYTKLGEWWEAQGGIWGGRWTGDKFGPCGDAGHFHYGFDKAQAVPTSICPSTVTLAECQALRQKYLEQQFAMGGGAGGGGSSGTGTSPWTLAAWAAVLGAGWLIFRGTLGVKPGSRILKPNPRRDTGWVSELLTKRDACRERMIAAFENDGMVVVEIHEGWRVSLFPSTRKQGYQLTFWDSSGAPVSHIEYDNIEKAASQLCLHNGRQISKQDALALSYRR